MSGNRTRGCEAIIVSNRRKDKLGTDYFDRLVYAVENAKGGAALLINFRRNLPIRVFRSSHENNIFPSPKHESGCPGYRYDGIYTIQRLSHTAEATNATGKSTKRKFLSITARDRTPSGTPRRLYLFSLTRVAVGKSPYKQNDLSVRKILQLMNCTKAKEKLRRLKIKTGTKRK